MNWTNESRKRKLRLPAGAGPSVVAVALLAVQPSNELYGGLGGDYFDITYKDVCSGEAYRQVGGVGLLSLDYRRRIRFDWLKVRATLGSGVGGMRGRVESTDDNPNPGPWSKDVLWALWGSGTVEFEAHWFSFEVGLFSMVGSYATAMDPGLTDLRLILPSAALRLGPKVFYFRAAFANDVVLPIFPSSSILDSGDGKYVGFGTLGLGTQGDRWLFELDCTVLALPVQGTVGVTFGKVTYLLRAKMGPGIAFLVGAGGRF